jgi:hypothetical protein
MGEEQLVMDHQIPEGQVDLEVVDLLMEVQILLEERELPDLQHKVMMVLLVME